MEEYTSLTALYRFRPLLSAGLIFACPVSWPPLLEEIVDTALLFPTVTFWKTIFQLWYHYVLSASHQSLS